MPTSRSRTARRYVVEDVCDAGASESFPDSTQDSQASSRAEMHLKSVVTRKRRAAASAGAFLDYHCPPEMP